MRAEIILMLFGVLLANAQENAQSKVSHGLLECYNNTYALLKCNRLPHNMHAFIGILRKVEENPLVDMDLRRLSVTLLQRFRQDGIVVNSEAVPQDGVTPFATEGFQFYKHAEMLKLIPGTALTFNNASISLIERCTFHSMISSAIDTLERGDESSTCRLESSNYSRFRYRRSFQRTEKSPDVETLTPEQIEIIKHANPDSDSFDPNSWYPPLPSNHPDLARLQMPSSKCPSESGIIKTAWGEVSGGPLLAGIAAALQPQNVRIGDLMRRAWETRDSLSSVTVDNKWIATLAGDLAEVALRQGPSKETIKIGSPGHWNSSHTPQYYFLNNDQGLEFTKAEVSGDIDGLILASKAADWYNSIPSLKLSQIYDMYYSDRGVFNESIRACNRKALFSEVVDKETIFAQTYRAAMVFNSNTKLPKGTLSDEKVESFSVEAVNELFRYVESMADDKSCANTDPPKNQYHRAAVDLTIILDTNWPYDRVKPILSYLLENIDINKFASNFTVMSANQGEDIVKSSHSILDFYGLNETIYNSFPKGFNLAKSLEIVKNLYLKKLNEERGKAGGARADIVLIVPWSSSSISDVDKEYSLNKIWEMREETPDVNILFLTAGSKERWTDLVQHNGDVFTVPSGIYREAIGPVNEVVNRIKRTPKRLINSACGADYSSSGGSNSFDDYLEPSGVQFYRLHPNYFFNRDENIAKVTVQGTSGGNFRICSSRNHLHINSTVYTECTTVSGNSHTFDVSCMDAEYIHKCDPLYLSIGLNKTSTESFPCTDKNKCRYPDQLKFTITYENLLCTSGASSSTMSFILLSLITIFAYIRNI